MKYVCICIVSVMICCSVVSQAEESGTVGGQRQKRIYQVDRAKENLREIKENKQRLKNLKLLSDIEVSDLPSAIKEGNNYGALLEKRVWEERVIESELYVLYASLLQYAKEHNASLPETLNVLNLADIELKRYDYFPLGKTNDLDRAGIVLLCRKLLSVRDDNVVYVGKGDKLLVMSFEAFKALEKMDKNVRLTPEMRQMVPQVFAMTGNGEVIRLTKVNYPEVIEKTNNARRSFGIQQVTMEILDKLFRNVDKDIYNYMPKKGPGTDKDGNIPTI